MYKKLRNRILQAIGENIFPACVVGVVRKNGERFIIPGGTFTFDPASPTVKEDAIFDVASITKVIPTSSLALQLIDTGKLNLEDKLVKFIPEFHNSHREDVLIKHLLTPTLDYDLPLSTYKESPPEKILDVILTADFKTRPGTKFHYLNATSILLGLVVERIFGEPLDSLGEKHFFRPLQMTRTSFYPLKKFNKNEIVPTEIQDWRGGLVQGEIHDETAYTLSKKMSVGAAGVFSTAPNILNFLEMIMNNGMRDGQQYFSPEIIQQIQTNQLAGTDQSAGLGWELQQPHYMGKYCSPKTFGKTGFTGCVCICDIDREVGFVILSNYTYPIRKPDKLPINQFRSDIADIVFENL